MSDSTKLETFLPCIGLDLGIFRRNPLKDLRTRKQHTKKMAKATQKKTLHDYKVYSKKNLKKIFFSHPNR